MDMYKLKFTSLQAEIFSLLCKKSGKELNQRQIAKIVGASPTAVAKSLHQMERNKLVLIKKETIMNLNLISLNRDDQKILRLKKIENLKLLYLSGVVDFLENMNPGASIILFGSYSRGDDLITSDIDIAVVGRKVKSLNLKKYELMLERKININFYDDFKSIHKNLRENLFNGIILIGGISL